MTYEQFHPDILTIAACKCSANIALNEEERAAIAAAFPDKEHFSNMIISVQTLEELDHICDQTTDSLNSFHQKYGHHFNTTPQSAKRTLSRITLAIAAITLIAVSAWLLYLSIAPNEQNKQDLSLASVITDIAPGTTGGMLVLANQETINLDSASKGIIATQGNIAIEKTNSGQLVYCARQEGPNDVVQNTFYTSNGRTNTITFPDGSRITINPQTSIRYPTTFEQNQREVYLQAGEAYFEISKGKPFVVQLDQFKIAVKGTKFTVNSYQGEKIIKTTLTEGSIKIIKGEEEVPLKPGQQATLNKQTGSISVRDAIDLPEETGWTTNHFVWRQLDLLSIAKQLERWYAIQINVNPAVANTPLTFRHSRNISLNELLQLLKQTGSFQYRIDRSNNSVYLFK